MKKIPNKILCIILIILTTLPFVDVVQASTKTSSPFKSYTYTHQTKFDDYNVVNGLDISKYDCQNSAINFNKLKKNGVDFVIIRVGYRGYGSKGTLCYDKTFDTNIKGAQEAGIKVGVYFYSQALTTEEATAEANFVYSKIKSYSLDLPVAFDYEFAPDSDGRLNVAWKNGTLNKRKMTNNAIAFCDAIQNYGYNSMIYASKSFLQNELYADELSKYYPIWLAHYTTSTDYSGDYTIWQYSSTGNCSGIDSGIDCDFMYVDDYNNLLFAPTIIAPKKRTYTGSPIKPSITVKYNGTELIKDTDYTISYSNNTNVGMAKINVTGIGEYEGFFKTINFAIVPKKSSTPTLVTRGTNSLTLKWDANEEKHTGYQVSIYRGGKWVTSGYTTDNTSYTDDSLGYACNYQFKVRSYVTVNGVKYYGYYSDILKTGTKPAKVTNLKQTSQGTDYINLTWDAQSHATGYYLQKYSPSKNAYYDYKYIEGGSNNKIKITGLKASTNYKFRIRAYKSSNNKKLYGSYSDKVTVGTSTTTTTLNKLSTPSKKNIKVYWNKISKVSGYQIQYSRYSNFSNKTTKSYSSKYSYGTIKTYSSKKRYYVRVRTYRTVNNKRIYSKYSNVKYITVK